MGSLGTIEDHAVSDSGVGFAENVRLCFQASVTVPEGTANDPSAHVALEHILGQRHLPKSPSRTVDASVFEYRPPTKTAARPAIRARVIFAAAQQNEEDELPNLGLGGDSVKSSPHRWY